MSLDLRGDPPDKYLYNKNKIIEALNRLVVTLAREES